MPKRRFLFYTRSLGGGGGAERVWAMLASHFAARGDQVVLALDEDGDRGALDPSVIVEIVGPGIGGIRPLARRLNSYRPDVALSAVSGNGTKLVLAKLLARSRVPLVVSFHGFAEYRTGRLSATAYYGMRLMKHAVRRVVCVSDALRMEMIVRWGADPARTVRIYNPVHIRTVSIDAAALAARPASIVAVGRLSAEKGFDDLVAAFANVDDPDATLTIAGEGPERATLERLIAEQGLGDRVRLPGFVDPATLYDTARLCVIPSRTEAFGMVAVEALAAGLPIVATDCAGPLEVLGAFGRIVPVGDVAAMTSAINLVLEGPVGDPAARIARAKLFSAEVGFANWAELLDQLSENAETRRRRLSWRS